MTADRSWGYDTAAALAVFDFTKGEVVPSRFKVPATSPAGAAARLNRRPGSGSIFPRLIAGAALFVCAAVLWPSIGGKP